MEDQKVGSVKVVLVEVIVGLNNLTLNRNTLAYMITGVGPGDNRSARRKPFGALRKTLTG